MGWDTFRIGIDEYHWKITPSGEVDSEGGLYLATEDLARIGYLILHEGNWDGNQVVSKEWVREAAVAHVPDVTPPGDGVIFGYGYQWWLPMWDSNPVYAIHGNGYGGQFLFVVPDLDMVVVFNGWNLHAAPNKSTMRAFLDIVLPAAQAAEVEG